MPTDNSSSPSKGKETTKQPDDAEERRRLREATTEGGPVPGGPLPLDEALRRLVRAPWPPPTDPDDSPKR